jgi:hypothetical protein
LRQETILKLHQNEEALRTAYSRIPTSTQIRFSSLCSHRLIMGPSQQPTRKLRCIRGAWLQTVVHLLDSLGPRIVQIEWWIQGQILETMIKATILIFIPTKALPTASRQWSPRPLGVELGTRV